MFIGLYADKMSQKVWVIKDSFKRSDSNAAGGVISAFHQDVKHKNPALAYSLSLLIWGCGQLYNRKWKSGILLFLFMIMFYLSMSMIIIHWTAIVKFFRSADVSLSETLLICGFFHLSGLITWHFNSCHAYFKAIKSNNNYFKGIRSILLPAACSLLMPGWGQFLNGQPKKGICFQIFSLAGLFAFPAILIVFLFWPTLEASQARLMVEWIFMISLIFTPFIVMIWLFSVYDAARVSMDNLKKEPLRKRIGYQINRHRHDIQVYGWKNAVLSIVKRIFIVILLLTLGVIGYHYIPKSYYIQQLMDLGNKISQEGMTVIPGLINYFCG